MHFWLRFSRVLKAIRGENRWLVDTTSLLNEAAGGAIFNGDLFEVVLLYRHRDTWPFPKRLIINTSRLGTGKSLQSCQFRLGIVTKEQNYLIIDSFSSRIYSFNPEDRRRNENRIERDSEKDCDGNPMFAQYS